MSEQLSEQKQTVPITPFMLSTPKLEASLAHIAECLTYFVNRQMELDKRDKEAREAALQDAFQGRDWSDA